MEDVAMSFARDGIFWMLKLALPILVVALLVGLFMGVIQAATQIQEASLSFVPKLLAISLFLFIAGPWMMDSMIELVKHFFTNFREIIGS